MNQYNKRVYHQPVLMLLIALFGLSSCIKEDLDECVIRVRFDYSYNMLSENKFGEQAEMLALYIFDDKGVLVDEKRRTGKFDHTSFIELTGIPKGNYKLVSWAKSTHLKDTKSDFVIPTLVIGSSTLDDLSYYLDIKSNTCQNELNHFLVGDSDLSVTDESANTEVTISHKKVTNRIKLVVLSSYGNELLKAEDLECSIIDEVGNVHINYNCERKNCEQTIYLPYYTGDELFENNANPDLSALKDKQYAVVSQFSVSRLFESNCPRVVIRKKDTSTPIMGIDIPEYCLLTLLEGHADEWSVQEYLDRQDEYSIVVYLGATTWTTIIINGWVINNIDIDI